MLPAVAGWLQKLGVMPVMLRDSKYLVQITLGTAYQHRMCGEG